MLRRRPVRSRSLRFMGNAKDKLQMPNNYHLPPTAHQRIQSIDIKPYLDKTADMIKHLLPDSKRQLNHNQFLQDTLLELNVVADGFYQWCKFLLMAQTQEQVTPQAFEKAYICLCWDGLLDWAERQMDLLELHYLATNQKANRTHLSNLAKRYRRGGYPLTRKLDPKTSQVVIVFDDEDKEEAEDLTILTTKETLLKENIELTTQNLKAVLWWRDVIIEWHHHKKISQEVFEDAFIMFCRFGLLDVDWVNYGLDEIYKVVTGQDVDNERLNAIEDLFSLYD